MDLDVSSALTIPASELSWRFSRSSGPGGQHVNTSDSRVELTWTVIDSAALSEGQRMLLVARIGPAASRRKRKTVSNEAAAAVGGVKFAGMPVAVLHDGEFGGHSHQVAEPGDQERDDGEQIVLAHREDGHRHPESMGRLLSSCRPSRVWPVYLVTIMRMMRRQS